MTLTTILLAGPRKTRSLRAMDGAIAHCQCPRPRSRRGRREHHADHTDALRVQACPAGCSGDAEVAGRREGDVVQRRLCLSVGQGEHLRQTGCPHLLRPKL